LLKNGADPLICKSNNMITPLDVAKKYGDKQTVKLIKQYLKK